MNELERKALTAIVPDKHVLWPSSKAHDVVRYSQTFDGRVHFIAPSALAAGLFERGYISKDGELTPAGREALKEGEK